MKNYLAKVLITGGDGQLACAFRHILPQAHFFNKHTLDITNKEKLTQVIALEQPTCIINTAAYTQVDKAETEKRLAEAINHIGAANVASIAATYHIPFIHLSTDYVFDGESAATYTEEAPTNPINVYGLSKLNGEKAILKINDQAIILRVSGVFSEFKHNFLKTMLRLAQEKQELTIVADQFTCPTYAKDIAQAIVAILKQAWIPGIYHFCAQRPVSWYDFASAIFAEAAHHTPLRIQKISACANHAYPTPAKRPLHAILNNDKIKKIYHIAQPSWQDGIKQSLAALFTEKTS